LKDKENRYEPPSKISPLLSPTPNARLITTGLVLLMGVTEMRERGATG
jgi:hypothetical protein